MSMFKWDVVDPAPGEARVVARAAGTDDDEGAVVVGPSGADRSPPAADDQ